MSLVPAGLRRCWASYWPGADVGAMARDVEARAQAAVAAWRLDDPAPLPGGNVAVVLATDDAVVKVSPRGHEQDHSLAMASEALAFWRPTGVVPALRAARDDGLTVLMERVRPGTPLDDAGLPFEERLRILGGLARRLHDAGPPPAGFETLRDYGARWGDVPGPAPGDVLLHADLHGGNVLRAADGWQVIDPHAVRGERHAEVWALLDPLVPEVPDAGTARRWLEVYAQAASIDAGRAAWWAHGRARAEARDVAADDPAWARRLARMADALA